MTAKTKKDSAGKALYLEFRKDQYTYQLIVTPFAITLENEVVKPAYIRRRISIWHPRRNWSSDFLLRVRQPERDSDGNFAKQSDLDTELLASVGYDSMAHLFSNLKSQDWNLYERPLVVEFSYEDLANIREGKTPNGLYRRIERSRKALSWSESLFNPEEAF